MERGDGYTITVVNAVSGGLAHNTICIQDDVLLGIL
jgi:hypothetical protein